MDKIAATTCWYMKYGGEKVKIRYFWGLEAQGLGIVDYGCDF